MGAADHEVHDGSYSNETRATAIKDGELFPGIPREYIHIVCILLYFITYAAVEV